MKCPRCGRPNATPTVCADCLDAVKTNLLWNVLTLGNQVPRERIVGGLITAGLLVLLLAMSLLAALGPERY